MNYQGFTRVGGNSKTTNFSQIYIEPRRFVACNKIFLCAPNSHYDKLSCIVLKYSVGVMCAIVLNKVVK